MDSFSTIVAHCGMTYVMQLMHLCAFILVLHVYTCVVRVNMLFTCVQLLYVYCVLHYIAAYS